jgi:tRNA-2-methylthio-N6-dimethylallyladenosine synthase
MGKKIPETLKFHIKTYGCQMNERDSEKVECIFNQAGFQHSSIEDADIVVINSCAVREKAEAKIYSEIGRIKSINPKAKIVSMGCVAQFNYGNLKRVSDFVVGTSAIDKFYEIAENYDGKALYIKDKMDNPDYIFPHRKSINAFVDIMYGCNNFCTYCIVPFTRGREISRTKESIIDEIKQLVDNGTKEVMLLGQNVNSYGHKLGYSFVDLLYEVDKIENLKRVRFTTSHPKDFSRELIYAMRDLKTLCEHIHLPLQSGSNKILKLMKRGYTKEEYLEKVYLFKDIVKNGSITTDIIVGFPLEDEDDFNITMDVVREVKYDTSYSFKYSKRPLTKAKDIEPQVEEGVKLRRLNELQDLQAEITQEKLKKSEGLIFDVLVEGRAKRGDMLFGRNRQNTVVNFTFKDNINSGDVVRIKITKSLKHSLVGEMV